MAIKSGKGMDRKLSVHGGDSTLRFACRATNCLGIAFRLSADTYETASLMQCSFCRTTTHGDPPRRPRL